MATRSGLTEALLQFAFHSVMLHDALSELSLAGQVEVVKKACYHLINRCSLVSCPFLHTQSSPKHSMSQDSGT